jgi:hypothetical protein
MSKKTYIDMKFFGYIAPSWVELRQRTVHHIDKLHINLFGNIVYINTLIAYQS